MLYDSIVSNLTGKTRRDKLMGRDCIVAPVTLIVPGVLDGSQGPIVYTNEENQKSADRELWNGMPLTLGHPTDDRGMPLSGRRPDVLNRFGLGTLLNVRNSDRLRGEAWFDVLSLQERAPDVLRRLESGMPIECSTGLRMDKIRLGKRTLAVNYRPDHLAVLPYSKGACSLEDGCGVLVNAAVGAWDKLKPLIGNAGFDSNQPRASDGEWTDTGAGSVGGGKLSNNPHDYFDFNHPQSKGARILKVKALETSHSFPDSNKEAIRRMNEAAAGRMDKRQAILVQDLGNGKYKVLDGNSTTHAAIEGGLEEVLAVVKPKPTPDNLEEFFKPEDVAGPDKTPHHNAQKTAEEVYATAAKDLEGFKRVLDHGSGLDKELGATLAGFDEAVKKTKNRIDKPLLIVAPLKGKVRAEEKVRNKYEGDWSRLTDVVRGTVVVEHIDDMPAVIASLNETAEKHGWEITDKSVESKFKNPTAAGYRDLSMLLDSPSGLKAELQINTRSMFVTKNTTGHKLYEEWRSIVERKDITPVERAKAEALADRMKGEYGKAFESDAGPAHNAESPTPRFYQEADGTLLSQLTPGHRFKIWQPKAGKWVDYDSPSNVFDSAVPIPAERAAEIVAGKGSDSSGDRNAGDDEEPPPVGNAGFDPSQPRETDGKWGDSGTVPSKYRTEELDKARAALASLPKESGDGYGYPNDTKVIRLENMGWSSYGGKAYGLPFTKDQLSKWGTVESVPLDGSIHRSQTEVVVKGIEATLKGTNYSQGELPELIREPDGELYVFSGHTRLSTESLAGRTHTNVVIYDVDAKGRLIKTKRVVRNAGFDPSQLRDAHGRWLKQDKDDDYKDILPDILTEEQKQYIIRLFGTPKVVVPTKEEAKGVDIGALKPGHCFDSAGQYVLSHPGLRDMELHHGLVDPSKGYLIAHSWVTIGDKVYDGTKSQFYDRSSYYEFTKAREEAVYTPTEMMKKVVDTENWGPWHDTKGLTANERADLNLFPLLPAEADSARKPVNLRGA